MKIVNRETFLALPSNTLFCKYKRCFFENYAIKHDTLENDFLYQDLKELDANDSGQWVEQLNDSTENGTSINLDLDCCSRDGLFDSDQLFAIFDNKDVSSIIQELKSALNKIKEEK